MARFTKQRWDGGAPGLPRRDRLPCDYLAYEPDPLRRRRFVLEGSVAADVAEAEAAIARLNAESVTPVDTEAVARLLLRAESVASSRIEGLEVGGRRLLHAEVARTIGAGAGDLTAEEVLGNIEAMTYAVGTLAAEGVTVPGLLEAHRLLLRGTRLSEHAGKIRVLQNWIGGGSHNPCRAAFVPPPPELVQSLLDDLCDFCERDDLPPLAQAAVAHAQFETIHPFVDGNGRTGRALIHVVLRRRGLAPRVLPPISLILATWAKDYVDGLVATRYEGDHDAPGAHEGLNAWIATFAAATTRSVADATSFEGQVRTIQEAWRRSLGRVRSDSAIDRLLRRLPGMPVVTVQTAADRIERSYQQTNEAIARLEEVGILARTSIGRRNRAFEARDIIDIFAALERALASPEGDTRSSPPTRPAPRRRGG